MKASDVSDEAKDFGKNRVTLGPRFHAEVCVMRYVLCSSWFIQLACCPVDFMHF